MKQQIRSTKPWTMLSLSRWQSMKAVHTYQLLYSRTHARIHAQTLLPFLSFHFLKREHKICCSTGGHLLRSSKHTHLPQTDSLAQDAQYGVDQHDQVLLFFNCNFLHICAKFFLSNLLIPVILYILTHLNSQVTVLRYTLSKD